MPRSTRQRSPTPGRNRLVPALAAASLAVTAAAAPPAGATDAGSATRGPALLEPERRLADALQCRESGKRGDREPVLFVHGITSTGAEEWEWSWVPVLVAEGYDVCALDLPDRGMEDEQRSAEYVVHAVREMADRFGSKVDVVGHSKGPVTARWALRWWPDVRAKVDDLVSLSGANRGTDLSKVLCADGECATALWQLARDSRFIAALNAGDESPGEVDYTSLYTKADEIVLPQVPMSVSEIGGAVNVPLDALCPGRLPEHVQSLYDSVAYAAAVDALTHEGPFDPARFDRATCAAPFMPGVTATEAAGRTYTIAEKGLPLLLGLAGTGADAEPPLRCYARPGCRD